MRVIFTSVLLLCLLPAHAETGPAIEWTQSRDHLSNGSADWHSEELRLSTRIAPRHLFDASLRQVRRFGLSDAQLEINYAFPVSERWSGALMASNSTTHRFLPKSDLGASLQYEVAPAWLLHAGANSAEYDTSSVTRALFGIEHYFSAFRWMAGWRPAHAAGVTAHGADARFDYYYSDLDFVGIQVTAGKEAANIDGRGVSVSSVNSTALVGRHGLSRQWTMRYGIERLKQGDFYNRTGVRLGVQYAF